MSVNDIKFGAFPSKWDYRMYRVPSPTKLQVEVLPTEYTELLEYSPDGPKGDSSKQHPDQGHIGQCVGFDGMMVLETTNNIEDKGFKDLSAWWAYNRSRFYAGITDIQGEGSTNFGLMQALHKEGCVPEPDCPTPKNLVPFECNVESGLEIAKNWAIDQYWFVNASPNDVKAAIYGITHEMPYNMPDGSTGKAPLVAAFPVYESFKVAYTNGGIVPEPFIMEPLLGGHSSPIFGWKVIDGKEYYVNYGSWGEDVGDGGIFYIPTNYPFYPNDFFLIHNGPPTNSPDPPSPSPCTRGNDSAKLLNVVPWALRRKGRFYYLNP